jgi:hypothetical protein
MAAWILYFVIPAAEALWPPMLLYLQRLNSTGTMGDTALMQVISARLPHRPLLGAGDIRKSTLVSLSLDRWPGFGSGTRRFVFKMQRG